MKKQLIYTDLKHDLHYCRPGVPATRLQRHKHIKGNRKLSPPKHTDSHNNSGKTIQQKSYHINFKTHEDDYNIVDIIITQVTTDAYI